MDKSRVSSIVFSIYILLAFYVFGGGIVNSLVAYRTWRWGRSGRIPMFLLAITNFSMLYIVVRRSGK
jgi:hypothetical protein